MQETDEITDVAVEEAQKPKRKLSIRLANILFALLTLALAAASVVVMLQSAGVIRYDRF